MNARTHTYDGDAHVPATDRAHRPQRAMPDKAMSQGPSALQPLQAPEPAALPAIFKPLAGKLLKQQLAGLGNNGALAALDGVHGVVTAARLVELLHARLKAAQNKAASTRAEDMNLATPERTNHILAGDESGGGHMFPGRPGKSPFPQDWSGKKIMAAISDVATDPAAQVKPGRGGRMLAEGTRDGVDIQVVLESPQRGGGIITGLPTNIPRNPR
jgi:hypothetical protein